MMNTEEEFKKIQKEMYDLFVKKNRDYGDGFVKQKLSGAFFDMKRKWTRLKTIFKEGEISNLEEVNVGEETVIDTLIDLANYCVLTCIRIKMGRKK